jgi:thiosulfate/3-mercaptopyruvate sulfurtransferase
LTGDELEALLAAGAVTLVDVRRRMEYEGTAGYPCDPVQGHIPGALHIDLDELLGAERDALRALLAERGVEAGKPLVLYCHSGSRSGIAVAALNAAGIDAENYAGSWHEWSRRATG